MRCVSARGGPGKLRSYWEQQVHVAVGQTGNPPVFEVRPERRSGKPRVLHINLLLPFDFLQVDHPDPSANQSQEKVPSSSSPVILWKKIGQPATNCNRRFFNGFTLQCILINISKVPKNPITGSYQKSGFIMKL